MWINLCEKKRIACLQSCIWANHRGLEWCILDSPMWWCFFKNMHRQWNQIGQHQHKCLIPTVKRGCWGGASFGCRRTWAPCKNFAFGELFCLPKCCGSNIWCNGWRSVTGKQEPMTLPAADSHSFTSTTRGANAKMITTSPYNFSGPAVWLIPVSDEICTF